MILTRVKDILRTEGLLSLATRVAVYLKSSLSHSIFLHRTYYLYEQTLGDFNEEDFIPRIQNITCEFVSTNQQASKLAANGFEDIRSRLLNTKRFLDGGAIACCIYHGRELVHISWIVTTEQAKSTVGYAPLQVHFSNNEACTAHASTVPKYRGKGLMTYSRLKRLQYMKERGIISTRNTVHTSNTSVQKILTKLGATRYARARHIKIFWWQYWREVPIQDTDVTNVTS